MAVDRGATAAPSHRFVVLDFYRYVAASGVVLFHIGTESPGRPVPLVGSYGLFVDMFFILSGFVIAYTHGTAITTTTAYWRFVVKRLARIYPLYLLVLLGFGWAEITWGGFSAGLPPGREFAVNLLMLQAWGFSSDLAFNPPAWSISAEWACYLLFPLLALAIARLPLWLAFALIGAGYLVGHHGHIPIWANPQSQILGANFDYGALRGLVGFANGIALCRLYAAVAPRPVFLLVGVLAMALGIVCMNVFAKGDLVILLMAVATLATALGEAARPMRGRVAQVLEWFGNASYAIYMLHWAFLLAIVLPFVRSHPGLSQLDLLGVLVVTIVGLTLLSRVTYRFFEVPARRWITRTFSPAASTSREASRA